ncbi:alpha-L-arabinofuranosidase II precursor [Lachnospiraceae bacterium KM106-2]|nr:alpha-L-arabinofuranosidase II precursor [Lachnospiraceae bacterium KM106-2]
MKGWKKKCLVLILSLSMIMSMLPQGMIHVIAKEEDTKGDSHLLANYVFTDENVEKTTIKDVSGNHMDATLEGTGASITDGVLHLPGGNSSSSAAYVSIPGKVFEDQDVLTITLWLKNETGANNYSAMWFGTPTKSYGGGSANMPLNYWLLNPAAPSGCFKSVWTDSNNQSAPYNTETATSSVKTSADWGMYTTVITKDSITGYYNGVKVESAEKTKTTTDFGTGLVAAIGRSGYADMYYKGGVRDVAVYDNALTQADIYSLYYQTLSADNKDEIIQKAIDGDEKSLNLGDISQIKKDLTLPSMGENGSKITWKSSNPDVIGEDGKVIRPNGEENVEVTLTATLQIESEKRTKEFKATVISGSISNKFKEVVNQFSLPVTMITDSIALPKTAGKVSNKDTWVNWTSSNESILTNEGVLISRPESEDVTITLTAKIGYQEGAKNYEATKEFTVTVLAKDSSYLMAYTNSSESVSLGDSLHLAYSTDGSNYSALNSNTGVCFAKNVGGSKNVNPNGLLSPQLFRKVDGTYGLVARNMSDQKYFYCFDSDDLIHFNNEHKLVVDENVKDIMECRYDDKEKAYAIYWSDGTNTYQTLTKDLNTTLKTERVSDYTKPEVKTAETLPEGAVVGSIISISRKETKLIKNKLGVVQNTGMEEISVNADTKSDVNALLPSKVTADYSDGSKTDMNVSWSKEDLKKIDLTKEGTYEVSGSVKQTQYSNPFITQRADPCITKGEDGYYYFTASYPMCGSKDKDGYDKITLRRSKTITGLQTAQEVTIWDCDDTTNEFRYIWAPEFHCINGKYYIFYTSSINTSVWSIRPHVLMCNDPSNIMDPSSWEAKGQMLANSTDTQAFQGFSLDMTCFENKGHFYVMWAQTDGFSSLFIAEIDPDKPWQCISDCVKISIPEYSWERINENVNEGPSVLSKNGKLYCTYSASGTGTEYCIGLLSADADDDLLKASTWEKQSYPVLTSSDVKGEYGPGHNSFTVDEDGNAIFVYHARGQECYDKECDWANENSLYDPCRDARIKRVHWAVDGSPILKMTYEEELAQSNQRIKAIVKVAKSEAEPVKEAEQVFTLTYLAGEGGRIQGEAKQNVSKGKNASQVIAVPAAGYQFVTWSDGVKTPSRTDTNVSESKTVTAQFVKETEQVYTLTYLAGEGGKIEGNTEQKIIKGKSGTPVTATASKGYHFVSWSDGIKQATRTELNVSQSLSVMAQFAKDTVAVKKVALSKKSLTIGVGESIKLKATISPSKATNKKITWKSSSSCVKVSKAGMITSKKVGSAVITAISSNGKKASIKVKVKKAPTKIQLNTKKKTLKKGKRYQIKIKLSKNAASYKNSFSSSKRSVAIVSSTGKITAKKKGVTTIVVKTYNGKKAKMKIIVK